MLSVINLVLIVFAIFVTGQDTHTVSVGIEGSFYDPPTTDALENDTITFIFGGVIHGVTQSSFDEPCLPLAGGFNSGLTGTNGNASAQTPTWNLHISNASEPIWFFCQATEPESHCQAGMVGAINPPSANMFLQFQSAAKVVSGTPSPTPTIVLTGVGAFATAPPTTTAVLEATPSSLSTRPPPSSLSSSSSSSSASSAASQTSPSSKSSSSGAVIGGAVGGTVAVVTIAILSFLLFRSRRRSRSDSPEMIDIIEHSSSAGFRSKLPASAGSTPTMGAFDRGLGYEDAETRKHRQVRSNDLSPGLERNSFSSPSDRTTSELGPSYTDGDQNREMQLRYASSHPEMRTSTTSNVYGPATFSQVHPGTFSPEQTRSDGQYPERGPTVNVHELAKEVASLIGTQDRMLPNNPGNLNQSISIPGRPPRQLPDPNEFLASRGLPSLEHESDLPKYEQ
ncbi:hypothetical protein M0805_008835 [Coniferiporia weirii]|nr:hypothetical protein M0805_008835 [Coniferiporia weirii]